MRSLLIAIVLACVALPTQAKDKQVTLPEHVEDKCALLTLDDGPSAKYTGHVLDVLGTAGVKALFFLVGENVDKNPDLVKRISGEGHELGNHSYTHPYLSSLSLAKAGHEITDTDESIIVTTGQRPQVLRAPFGDLPNDLRVVGGGRPFIGWTNDTSDYKKTTSQSAIVTRATKGGRVIVILMHDIHQRSLLALPRVIAGLKAKGYRFVKATELLAGACGFVAEPNLVFGPDYIPRRLREAVVRKTK